MKNLAIPFRKKEIECNLTYITGRGVSLVIDVIRHYQRIVFRGFAVAEHEKRDFSGFFPFPDEGDPFSGVSEGNRVRMDMNRHRIEGSFSGEPPISFDLEFTIEDYYFSSSKPGWIDKVPLLSGLSRRIDLTKGVSLLHEDFPLVRFSGDVTFGGRHFSLEEAKGSILHHWGWYFPDYLFLVCNDFEDPSVMVSAAFVNSAITAGLGISGGYLYLHHGGHETKAVSPLNSRVIYFQEEGVVSIVVRSGEHDFIRINLDPTPGAWFPHVFNTKCLTILNAECEVEGIGRSAKALLDVKGLDLIHTIR